jgi:hypothetical protein
VAVAAVAVTEDGRVAVVEGLLVVLGVSMGRAEGIQPPDRQTDGTALSRLPAIATNHCRQTGPQCNRPDVPKQDPKQGDAAR